MLQCKCKLIYFFIMRILVNTLKVDELTIAIPYSINFPLILFILFCISSVSSNWSPYWLLSRIQSRCFYLSFTSPSFKSDSLLLPSVVDFGILASILLRWLYQINLFCFFLTVFPISVTFTAVTYSSRLIFIYLWIYWSKI